MSVHNNVATPFLKRYFFLGKMSQTKGKVCFFFRDTVDALATSKCFSRIKLFLKMLKIFTLAKQFSVLSKG